MNTWKVEKYNVICKNGECSLENIPIASLIVPIITSDPMEVIPDVVERWVNEKRADELDKLAERMAREESNSQTDNYFASPDNITLDTVIFDNLCGIVTDFAKAIVKNRNYEYVLWKPMY